MERIFELLAIIYYVGSHLHLLIAFNLSWCKRCTILSCKIHAIPCVYIGTWHTKVTCKVQEFIKKDRNCTFLVRRDKRGYVSLESINNKISAEADMFCWTRNCFNPLLPLFVNRMTSKTYHHHRLWDNVFSYF